MIDRIKKAWQALRGKLPVEHVLDCPSIEQVYMVGDYSVFGSAPRFYATCQQAHQTEPGRQVVAVDGLRVGQKLFRLPYRRIWEVELQAKPKRAKGKPLGREA